ncbi:MAG: hypothetical protein LBR80_14310 [Deltaproteobacteria bacterium]|jgi:hypothetical protein|nr:hypothetical protein [Deltaproteobacteria bacterium]
MGFVSSTVVRMVKNRFKCQLDGTGPGRDIALARYFLTSAERFGRLEGVIGEISGHWEGDGECPSVYFTQELEALREIDLRLALEYPWLRESVARAFPQLACEGNGGHPSPPQAEDAGDGRGAWPCPEPIRLAFDTIHDDALLLESYLGYLTRLSADCLRRARLRQDGKGPASSQSGAADVA